MYKLIYFIILKSSLSTILPKIKNSNFPICINCLHFIEHTNNYPYDSVPNNQDFGKCKKFGKINLINGIIEYEFAQICRNDKKKCGITGIEYEEKQ